MKGNNISIIAEDQAIARFGREVVFKSSLELFKKNISLLSCLKHQGLIFKFSEINPLSLNKKIDFKRQNKDLEELIILKKALSFSNDFNTLKSDSRLSRDLLACKLPTYDQWSHTLKELVSFEIYLRDRFLSSGVKVNNSFKKLLATFRESIIQRDNHEWLIP